MKRPNRKSIPRLEKPGTCLYCGAHATSMLCKNCATHLDVATNGTENTAQASDDACPVTRNLKQLKNSIEHLEDYWTEQGRKQ